MIRRLQFSIFSVFFIFVAMTTALAETPSTQYKNAKNGFSFNVPAKWEIQEVNGGREVTVTSPAPEHAVNQFRPNAHISMEILEQNKTMDQYAQQVIAKLRTRMTDLQFLRTGRQTISHTPARWWIITYREKSVNVKGFLFIVLKGNKAFTTSAVAALEQYPAYKDILSTIGGSLTIY